MKAARKLREKIDSRILTTGVIATFHLWPELVEILYKAGIDYLVIDGEHGMHSDDLISHVCAIGRLIDFPVLIRPIDSNSSTIRRAIDCGSCGLLLPTIESPNQLDTVRDYIYMPPRGKRRPGGPSTMWVNDYNYSTWKSEVEDNFIILPQIETKLGLVNVDAIAAHEITTAIAIGPYDLSVDLGVNLDPENPSLLEAVNRIRHAGQKAGKNMWNIGDGPSLVEQGFTFICIGEISFILQKVLNDINNNTKLGHK